MKEVNRIILFFSELQEGCGLLSGVACWINQSCLTFCDPTDCSPLGSSVYGIPRQEYWTGLPFSPPGNLPDPVLEPASPRSPALQVHSLPRAPGCDVLRSGCGLVEKDKDIRISMGRSGAGSFSLWVSRCNDSPLGMSDSVWLGPVFNNLRVRENPDYEKAKLWIFILLKCE